MGACVRAGLCLSVAYFLAMTRIGAVSIELSEPEFRHLDRPVSVFVVAYGYDLFILAGGSHSVRNRRIRISGFAQNLSQMVVTGDYQSHLEFLGARPACRIPKAMNYLEPKYRRL